jgi:hypothetical protein
MCAKCPVSFSLAGLDVMKITNYETPEYVVMSLLLLLPQIQIFSYVLRHPQSVFFP